MWHCISAWSLGGRAMIELLLCVAIAIVALVQHWQWRTQRKEMRVLLQLLESKAETLQVQIDAQFMMIQELKERG
jgi:hypothetical protein